MTNLVSKLALTPVIKTPQHLKLTSVPQLQRVNVFSLPSRISTKDIRSMFNGLLSLINEKSRQEQNEKYLQLKLQYSRLQYLYNKLRTKLYKKQIN